MARVGIVSYWAPPQPAVASHRVLRITRALEAAGHEVHWVTLDPALVRARDASIERLIPPGVRVHGLGAPCLITKPKADGFLEKVLRTLVYKLTSWFAVPDGYVEWTFRLRRRLARIAREARLDAILVTCGPHGQILPLPGVRRRVPGLRIFVDYRDLLSGNFWRESKQAKRREKLLAKERRALRAADALFLNTQDALETFRSLVDPEGTVDARVMRNGADYDLADRLARERPAPDLGPGVHIGYFGTIFPRRRLEPLLSAMAALPPDALARVSFHCWCDAPESKALLDDDAQKAGEPVRARVFWHEPVPFDAALGAMRAMDALLLVNGPEDRDRIFVPGKLYDYIMARRPVLFVGGVGDAWRIVAATSGEEWCFLHGRKEEVAARLRALTAGRPADLPPNEEYSIARSFAPLLERLGPSPAAAPPAPPASLAPASGGRA